MFVTEPLQALLPLPETIYFLVIKGFLKFTFFFFQNSSKQEQFSKSIDNFNTKQLNKFSIRDSKHIIYSNIKVIFLIHTINV